MRRIQLSWVLIGLALAATTAPASGGSPPTELPATVVENDLVFQRQGGETIHFPPGTTAWVWCGPWEEENVETPSLHILTYDPDVLVPGWRIDIVLADVTLESPLLFPNHWIWPNPDSVTVFVLDPPNEAATNSDGSGGSIVFHALDCGPPGDVWFSIDATVGSEFGDGSPITIHGDFRATLTGPPTPARATTWGAIRSIYR